MKRLTYLLLSLIVFVFLGLVFIKATGNQLEERFKTYKDYAYASKIEWYYIAAIDQFERNTKPFRDYCPKEETVVSICMSPEQWAGANNPNLEDQDIVTIKAFNGLGLDGNNDGIANRLNNDDAMTAMITFIAHYGTSEEAIKSALMDFYGREKTVQIIMEMSAVIKKFNTIDLGKRVYPIPKGYNEDMVHNWGASRGYKGVRSHEGTDIFANYGVPLVSTAYGYIEVMGWNELGGYRIGIRDIYGTYEYYAHLQSFAKGLKEGDIVEAGQLIGYVGATGYGKEGTSGKFPPHLHFGFYKYDGRREWAFDPYPHLIKWEKIWLKSK